MPILRSSCRAVATSRAADGGRTNVFFVRFGAFKALEPSPRDSHAKESTDSRQGGAREIDTIATAYRYVSLGFHGETLMKPCGVLSYVGRGKKKK